MSGAKTIIVSNRLPLSVKKVRGKLVFEESSGGLGRGLSSIPEDERVWIGWPGIVSNVLDAKDKATINREMKKHGYVPVYLTRQQVKEYYDGYSNETLWPLFHYFPQYTTYKKNYWKAYQEVNELFAKTVLSYAGAGSKVWVHDYHLMLTPAMMRAKQPDLSIGFFLHIPFPSFELFRLLPQRSELLEGILGADMIGFHTHDYARHFFSCAFNLGGYEHSGGLLNVGTRSVRIDAFPISIDTDKFAEAAESVGTAEAVQELAGSLDGRQLILSVDRLDYSKGIPERLEAYSTFLKNHPEMHGKVVMLLLAVPSRINVGMYKNLRMAVEQAVSRINGNYATVDWIPIRYIFRNLPFEQVVPLYRHASVAMVTPLRDGMNLVAKEYVAAQSEETPGVLILSETAGAATELSDALLVNPHDRAMVASSLHQALTMPKEERLERLFHMRARLNEYTVIDWAEDFMAELQAHTDSMAKTRIAGVSSAVQRDMVSAYKSARSRLLLLDYDGTLSAYTSRPEQALPPTQLRTLLQRLGERNGTEVVVISGRTRENMDHWFKDLPISLVAEHGACTKERGKNWHCKPHRSHDWKPGVMELWKPFERRTPGGMIEEKEYSMVWHYRRVPGELAKLRLQQLISATGPMAENLELGLYQGRKLLEIRQNDNSKAVPAEGWLQRKDWDFVLAAGDDYTDEDIFRILPDGSFAIKVGGGATSAHYRTPNSEAVLDLLKELARTNPKPPASGSGAKSAAKSGSAGKGASPARPRVSSR